VGGLGPRVCVSALNPFPPTRGWYWLVLGAAAGHLALSSAATGLLAWQLAITASDASRNITTNERINAARYKYMWHGGGSCRSPFDRGIVQNLLQFLGVRGYRVDWGSVYTLDDYVVQIGES
jgi:hypothetical protein